MLRVERVAALILFANDAPPDTVLAAGMDAYLSKPVGAAPILDMLAQAAERRWQRH